MKADTVRLYIVQRPATERRRRLRCTAPRPRLAWLALALVFAGAFAPATPVAARAAACTVAADCAAYLSLAGGGLARYFSSRPLAGDAAATRVVFVIHGNGRNADDYFGYAIRAADLERTLESTVVVAPNFRTAADGPRPGEHYWGSGGWKAGDRSRDAARVSSFAVMDQFLARVCAVGHAAFPKLRTVVLIGHSAGAQFVSRYAAGGAGCPDASIEVRYVVMNPSSYLYIDGRRATGPDGFRVPRTVCRDYDAYKYGLQDLNRYMRAVGVAEIRRRLFTRRITYLAGTEDTRKDRSLDQRCAAMLQGEHRLARFTYYRAYAALFPDWRASAFAVVPGIGHSGRRMLASEAARAVTFR